MILRDHLDADQMRSLEDTMKSNSPGLPGELVRMGTRQDTTQMNAHHRPGFPPDTMETKSDVNST